MRILFSFAKLLSVLILVTLGLLSTGCRTTGEGVDFNLSPIASYYKRHNASEAYVNDINHQKLENTSATDTFSLNVSKIVTEHKSKGMFGLHNKILDRLPNTVFEKLEILYPFIEYKKHAGGKSEYGFRPLFYVSNDSVKDTTKIDILYPLARYFESPSENKMFLYPFFYYDELRSKDGRVDLDSFFFPLVFYGKETFPKAPQKLTSIMHKDKNDDRQISFYEFSGTKTQFDTFDLNRNGLITSDEAVLALSQERVLSYFAIFPLGGKIRDFFLKEWIEFFLFPLYYHAMEGGYESFYLLFPIFHWGYGDGRNSFAIFPFYSQDTRRYIVEDSAGNLSEGPRQYSRYTFLWPLINYAVDWSLFKKPGADGKKTYEHKKYSESLYIFPFYAHQITQKSQTYSVLFPFFTYRYDKRTDLESWDILYPIFKYASGIGHYSLRLFPLFETYNIIRENGSEASTFKLLGPLIWIESDKNKFENVDMAFIFGLFWNKNYKKFDLSTGKVRATKSKTKLWPMFGFDSEYDGSYRFEVFSLLPMSEIPDHDSIWAPFWRLFFYEYIPAEEITRFNAIGPFIRYEKNPDRTKFDFFPFVQYRNTRGIDGKSRESSFDFLYGLVGGGKDEVGAYIRLLWFLKFHTSDN
ncbi:MAG: hypothetical protein K8S87_08640 [Planctomycetes bacterium]|nr:hypothetical protein [Planctomycetota bacterium]